MLIVALTAMLSGDVSWTPRAISQYARTRSGRQGTIWEGRGSLINTVTGMHIANVGMLERCTPSGPDGFESDRVVVYRDANGSRLTRFSGKPVRPLRYAHNVSLVMAESGLLLQAKGPDGQTVASGWGGGRGVHRLGMRRAFDLSVRPSPRDTAAAHPPEAQPVGAARAAVRGSGGATREEYRLVKPAVPGGSCYLRYRRTGRCPSWCGQGVCTLEIRAASEAGNRRWSWLPWRRQAAPPPDWDSRVAALVEAD